MPSTVPSPETSKLIEKEIKFRSIGKRTVAGAKNGKKKINQDSIFIDTHILGKGNERISLFAVFDGHGQCGDKVSRFLIGNLKNTFRNIYNNVVINGEHSQPPNKKMSHLEISTQSSSKQESEIYYKLMTELCVVLNYKLNDQTMFDTQLSGSTGIIVACIKNQLVTANIGDSRAVMITEKKKKFVNSKKISLHRRSNSNFVSKNTISVRKGSSRKGSLNNRKYENIRKRLNMDKSETVIGSYALSRDLLPSLDIER